MDGKWSFAYSQASMAEIVRLSAIWARKYGLEEDDLRQEALLYVGEHRAEPLKAVQRCAQKLHRDRQRHAHVPLDDISPDRY